MPQAITVQVKLQPDIILGGLLKSSSLCYIQTVNSLVRRMLEEDRRKVFSTSEFKADLNSSVKNEAAKQAKSIVDKYHKNNDSDFATLAKPVISWNNQNYDFSSEGIIIPLMVNGKSERITIPCVWTRRINELLNSSKLGNLRLTKKNNKWIAQIAHEVITPSLSNSTKVMGVDLGIKVPAACLTEEEEVLFVGNGRKNKWIRRYHQYRRRKLGALKKPKAIIKSEDKEQRWMKDQDHKISRSIVNFAISKNVGIIRLENLEGIRQTTRASRKNNRSLSNWSFYRLASYIQYKAGLVGIEVQLVDPKYTSQSCPACGKRHKAKDRKYTCRDCGYTSHRDLVGARNIITAPVLDGNNLAA